MGSGSVCEAAVAQPFGYTEREQQAAEGEAGQGDDEREPASVCAGAGGRKAAEQRLKQQCSEEACADDGGSPLEELAGSVVGLGSGHDYLWCEECSAGRGIPGLRIETGDTRRLCLGEAEHHVGDDAGDGDVQPEWEGPASDFAVLGDAARE